MDIVTLMQQQHQTLDGNNQGQKEQDHMNNGAYVAASAEGHAVDRFRGEAGCLAKEMAVVASDNDSVGDSSTQCSDVIDDDNEEEETDVEESGAGGWIINPPVSTIVQQHQAFDTTNGYIALPNPDSLNFSDVRVKDSRNVHLGSEVNYNGSVTIHVKHVVYTSSLTQDASKSDTSVSDNTSNLSTNKDNGDINRSIFQQNIKLNKVTQWLWTWKRAVLSCVITLILLAVVVPITVHFTHKSDASISPEISNSSLEDPDKVSPLSGYYKVVCYFTNWAWYRRGIGRYLPEHIDHTLCTHIVYGFAMLDYSELVIKTNDSWADYDNRFYERVVAYKKRGLKVLLALGGWNDSAGDKYSRLVNSPSARKKFINHAIQFIEKYGFDGLDLDWEYPVCWQANCNKGPDSDKESFAVILRELSAEFKPKGLLLSAAVSPNILVIDKGYDVPTLAKYLDWIAVMAYDYHGQWDKRTGHVAPLYHHPDDEFYYLNANYSINYWISKGAPPRSIVMGMPLYGHSFSIHNPRAGTGLNSPASAGNAGEFTGIAGFLSYYEICDRVCNRGWMVVQDPEGRMGPYAYKGSQWVSFDDSEMIRRKAQFVRDMGLGGGMVWALDLDDFHGRCDNGPHPLMHMIQRVLAEPPKEHDRHLKPVESKLPPPTMTTWTVKPTQAIQTTTTVDRVSHDSSGEFKVICYFTNWAGYRQEGGRFVPEDIDSDLCTHVLYGFSVLDGSSLTMKSDDPKSDIDNKFYERVAAFKAKGLKVLMTLGGWNDSAGDKYSRLVNSPSARRRFITQVLVFIEKYGFEGLDLDWKYPVCWQADCNKGPESDKQSFAELVKELSNEFKPRGLLLSAVVSPSKRVINAGYDVPILSKYLDWISVKTDNFHGQWDKKTGHVAPLYSLPNDWKPTFNA
ncbi:LOW QUALITY PROTEIN: probable chitinase 10, partial [Temnothorax longispinosus]|uniref:LOW QUALITY PROTEIN: probable chitinase 10 n=1 Tax=Temnothorax longispinosus TaxID=300112 RepID=UPI003A98CEBA